MRINTILDFFEKISRSFGFVAPDTSPIDVPSEEQRRRGRQAFQRLRAQAQKMKSPLSDTEILDLIRSGRR